jgi:hypothetical protein
MHIFAQLSPYRSTHPSSRFLIEMVHRVGPLQIYQNRQLEVRVATAQHIHLINIKYSMAHRADCNLIITNATKCGFIKLSERYDGRLPIWSPVSVQRVHIHICPCHIKVCRCTQVHHIRPTITAHLNHSECFQIIHNAL